MLWFLYVASFVVLLFLWIYPKYMRIRRINQYFKEIPGPKVKSLFSDLGPVLKQNLDLQDRIKSLLEAYPRLFQEGLIGIWASVIPVVLLYKPETVEVVMNNSSSMDKAEEYDLVRPWIGDGLITSKGRLWKKHRKILTPAFHFRILEEFIPIINEQSKILVEQLMNKRNEPWIDVLLYVTRCTLDIICETSMGVKLGSQCGKEPEYSKALSCVQESVLIRSTIPWLRPNAIFYALPQGREYLRQLKVVRNFTKQVVQDRKFQLLSQGGKYYEQSSKPDENSCKPKRRLAFLDLLLQYHINDKELSEEEVQDEVNTFMFAGHDTTSHGISWTLYLLGLHPEIQEKVHQELDEVFGQKKDRPVEIEDMKKLKYLECVIKESQRLYPPVPVISRRINEDIVVNGYTIPKGVSCVFMLRELHRNPKIFHDSERFIPERFFPENCKERHPYAFVPFSAGPRNCIGQRFAMHEEKIVLSTLLRNFSVVSLDEQDKLMVDLSVVLKPRGPLRMKFIPR